MRKKLETLVTLMPFQDNFLFFNVQSFLLPASLRTRGKSLFLNTA